jgi:hypothetical protein
MEWFLSLVPSDVLSFFAVIFLSYITYWVYSNRKILLACALAGVVGYVAYLQYTKRDLTQQVQSSMVYDGFSRSSLGYSLNNPGNIRNSPNKFSGEITSSNKAFKEFSDMKYGFKAMSSLLHTYIRSGYNTIGTIINRYAPSSDGNNPQHYAAQVAKNANVPVDKILGDQDFRNGNMMNIIYFMTKVEQGYSPNIKDLCDGFDMHMREINN